MVFVAIGVCFKHTDVVISKNMVYLALTAFCGVWHELQALIRLPFNTLVFGCVQKEIIITAPVADQLFSGGLVIVRTPAFNTVVGHFDALMAVAGHMVPRLAMIASVLSFGEFRAPADWEMFSFIAAWGGPSHVIFCFAFLAV